MISISPLLPALLLGLGGMVLLVLGVIGKKVALSLTNSGALVLLACAAAASVAAPDGLLWGGLLKTTLFTRFADSLIYLGAIAALMLSFDYNKKEGIGRFEYPILVLFATLGMIVMVSANDLMSLYVGFELQSLALYIAAALARDSLRSTEAGLKYFVLGALASGLLIYGISLTYGFTGTTSFTGIASVLTSSVSKGALVGLTFVVVGLAFKISAAPFHMWAPDVYEGAPTSVSALFGTAPKAAAFALFLSVLTGPFGPLLKEWQPLIIILSVLSMGLGAVAAIAQTNIKRLLAYSSIGHMGYALIGFAAGTAAGYQASLIYVALYVVMSAGAFACVIAFRRNGQAVETIADLAGLGAERPGLALALAIFMWAMAGLPPLSGFFGKLYVFLAAIDSGLISLAIFGVLTSVIGAYYYLRVIKVMYFDAGSPGFDPAAPGVRFIIGAGAVVTVLFIAAPGPLITAAAAAAKALMG
jgi:NADH-quinone oxidoreductase subunit N